MITRVGLEYQQRNDEVGVVGGLVLVYQLVQNIPVRGKAFLTMFYDSTSNLSSVEYQWLKVRTQNMMVSSDLNYVMDLHQKIFEKKLSEISESLYLNKMSGNLYGAVKSWHVIESGGQGNILQPCITYFGKYNDGDVVRYFSFDVDVFSIDKKNVELDICSGKDENL